MSDQETQIDAAIAEYYRLLESGTIPDRATFLESHSNLRSELESFLHNKTVFDRYAGSATKTSEPATVAPAAIDEDALGSLRYFGDIELLEELARGGMGVVFRARQVSLNRIVALKLILAGQFAKPEDVQRFRAEADAAAALDHPNILPVYEVGSLQGQQCFAMKLVERETLADGLLKLRGVVDSTLLRSVAYQLLLVARAVHFAHQRGILHRDLKPGNILIDRDAAPFVTDFGLAKRVDGDSGLTQTGAIVVTPSYMAPEQARAEKQLSTAVDAYSLGAMLYEALTGQPPFRAATVMETILQVIEKEPEHPTRVNTQADRDLSIVALKCLEKDPARRYQSAAEFADDLERWSNGAPILARKAGPVTKLMEWAKRRNAVAVLLSLLLCTLVGGAIGLWVSPTQTQTALTDAEQQLYVSRVSQTARELNDNNYSRADLLLKKVTPTRRQWEWNYLWRKCHSEDRLIEEKLGRLSAIAGSADGNRFVISGYGGAELPARVYDGRNIRYALSIPNPTTTNILCLAMTRDGKKVAAGFTNGAVVWLADGTFNLTVVAGQVDRIALSDDGEMLATTGMDGVIKLWKKNTLLHMLPKHEHYVYGLTFHPNGRELASISPREVRITNVATGVKPQSWIPEDEKLNVKKQALSVAYDAKGSTLFVGSDIAVLSYEPWTGKLQTIMRAPQGLLHAVSTITVSPDGRYLLTTGKLDTGAHFWDIQSGQYLAAYWGHFAELSGGIFSAGSSQAISISEDGCMRVWSVPPRTNPAATDLIDDQFTALSYSHNGKFLGAGDGKG